MKDLHIAIGVLALGVNGLAGGWGAWCWHRAESSRLFWRLLRAGQLSVVLVAADGGIWALTGHPVSSIHLLYGALPVLVSFIGEALRISTAQMVLDARGIASPAEVGEMDPVDQRLIVNTIVQREIGVMALAALVIVVLLARAAATGT